MPPRQGNPSVSNGRTENPAPVPRPCRGANHQRGNDNRGKRESHLDAGDCNQKVDWSPFGPFAFRPVKRAINKSSRYPAAMETTHDIKWSYLSTQGGKAEEAKEIAPFRADSSVFLSTLHSQGQAPEHAHTELWHPHLYPWPYRRRPGVRV